MGILKLSEEMISSRCCEITVEGELDLAVAAQLRDAIERSQAEQTLIDLRTCEFLDSTGIAVLVRAHQKAADEGRRLVVHSPSSQVARVLEITGLTDNGLVFETREQALAPC